MSLSRPVCEGGEFMSPSESNASSAGPGRDGTVKEGKEPGWRGQGLGSGWRQKACMLCFKG